MPDHVASPGGESESAAPARLAELVAARVCHDLVNPIGAIGNGVELMRELAGGDAEDLDLVASSTARAAGLLRLHRLAFGPQPAGSAPVARAELAARLDPVFAGGRVTLALEHPEGPALPAPAARLAALMGLAGRALAGGAAEVVLALAPQDGLPIGLAVTGAGVGWPADLEGLVAGRGLPGSPREVEFALLPVAARAAGAALEVSEEPGRAALAARAG